MHESKVNEITSEDRNQTEVNLVGYELKVYRIKKYGIGLSF